MKKNNQVRCGVVADIVWRELRKLKSSFEKNNETLSDYYELKSRSYFALNIYGRTLRAFEEFRTFLKAYISSDIIAET